MSVFDGGSKGTEAVEDAATVEAVPQPVEAIPQPVSTLNQAVQYDAGDSSTFRPSATLQHGPQLEGESRADYMNRLARGSGMDRIVQ